MRTLRLNLYLDGSVDMVAYGLRAVACSADAVVAVELATYSTGQCLI